ncbi:cell division protein FtsZ [Candidatus Uhrbacteria bacterium]|nr:cell division protein FtsZ [Candidatus Uhrbacteria bacterium]
MIAMDSKTQGVQFARIKVVGVGGSGGSTINWMIQSKVKGVEFVAINTDAQALLSSNAGSKIHIGKTVTRGLGAGMDPEVGRRAAEENQNEIRDALKGADMVFVTCGLGGGTGTGAAPIVADIARDLGALTVGVVTKPFSFEGAQRANIADRGHQDLIGKVDTVITIPNDRVLQVADAKTTLLEAFGIVNEVLRQGVQGIAEVITISGNINVDFADVKTIMKEAGSALMGIGEGTGEKRAVKAAQAAIASPLLDVSIQGAKGLLFTITGGKDLTMQEVHEASTLITEAADKNAKIIWGTVIDDEYKDRIRITVVATGFGPLSTASKAESPKAERTIFSSLLRTETVPPRSQHQPNNAGSSAVSMSQKSASSRPTSSVSSPVPSIDPSDDELDIPAFLRKKIGR